MIVGEGDGGAVALEGELGVVDAEEVQDGGVVIVQPGPFGGFEQPWFESPAVERAEGERLEGEEIANGMMGAKTVDQALADAQSRINELLANAK